MLANIIDDNLELNGDPNLDFTYFVDSLWESPLATLLKKQHIHTDILLDNEIDLDEREEISRVNLLVCVCKRAATGQRPPGRILSRKMTNDEKRMVKEDKTNLTLHFIEKLPRLIEKFAGGAHNSKTMAYLLTLPQFFDLSLYASKRLQNLRELLGHLESQTEATASDLLEAISTTYHDLHDKDFPFYQTVDTQFQRITNKIREDLIDSLEPRQQLIKMFEKDGGIDKTSLCLC